MMVYQLKMGQECFFLYPVIRRCSSYAAEKAELIKLRLKRCKFVRKRHVYFFVTGCNNSEAPGMTGWLKNIPPHCWGKPRKREDIYR